jgi:penicillin-binding protein 2
LSDLSPTGRFLPPDPRIEEPYRLTPRTALRIAILGVFAVVLFAVLFLRLWALQVISGDRYQQVAENNQVRDVRVQPPRGPILDRNGVPLVTNVAGTVVQLWPAYVPKGQLAGVVTRLSALLDVPQNDIWKGIKQRANDPLTPVIVKTSVHDPKAEYLQEHLLEFPGVKVAATQLRRYDQGSIAAQILGYPGEISAAELSAFGPTYVPGDRIGKTGIERSYERYLRGEPGVDQVVQDAAGHFKSELLPSRLPKAGYAVRLTIDANLQRAAEQAIQDGITLAHDHSEWAAYGGAIVAMNPENGEILAMASSPSYDPSIFSGRVDPQKYGDLFGPLRAAQRNYPTLDRPIQGVYPPGSTFKPVVALAALARNLVRPDDLIQCTGKTVIDGQTFHNWNPDVNEAMTLPVALAASCDTYFYELGKRFYDEKGTPLQDWARVLGFGRKTGVDVGPEYVGLVPTPAWRKRAYNRPVDKLWGTGLSAQLAIGQAQLTVTPLQLTRFYALLANGGKLVEPHLVKDIEQPASSNAEAPVVLKTFAAAPARSVGLPEWAINTVRDGLYAATHYTYGTAYGVFGTFPVPVAGKTGTAEQPKQLPAGYPGVEGKSHIGNFAQSWFCGFGPTDDDPNYKPLVVCALIENGGHGGDAAAPAALEVFAKYWHQTPPPLGTINSD